MIREHNAQSAIDAAAEFDKRGLGLTFKEGTFLQALYASATVDHKVPTNVAGASFEPSATAISAMSAIVPMGCTVSPHDAMLERVIIEVSDAVRQHVFVYKNTVRPLVKEFVERMEAALQAMPAEATFNPVVVRVDLPLPLQSNLFQGLVEEYAGSPYRPLKGGLGLPPMTGEALVAMLKQGSAAADADIDAWVASVGADWIELVYNEVFGRGRISTSFADVSRGADMALAAFLLGKKLLNDVPEGTTMGLTEYRTEIGEVIVQAGLRLTQAYADRSQYEKAGVLVLGKDKDSVRVVASVYDQWLEAGNNVAVLFGSLLSDRPATSAEGLTAGAAEYLSVWENHNRNLTVTLQSRRYVDTIAMIKFKVAALVAERLQDCFGSLIDGQVNFDTPAVAEAQKRWDAIIDTYTLDDLKDLWKVGTEVIAGGVFYYTDAQKFLETLEGLMRDNPELPPAEAALMATTELVVDYVADQITVFDL